MKTSTICWSTLPYTACALGCCACNIQWSHTKLLQINLQIVQIEFIHIPLHPTAGIFRIYGTVLPKWARKLTCTQNFFIKECAHVLMKNPLWMCGLPNWWGALLNDLRVMVGTNLFSFIPLLEWEMSGFSWVNGLCQCREWKSKFIPRTLFKYRNRNTQNVL